MPSVVKHSFIQAKSENAKAKAKAHLNYIQHRAGHDKEQGGRPFFDKDRDQTDGADFRKALNQAPGHGTLMHKLILSPGVQGIDLREYTREVMDELGEGRGLDLEWQAVVHTNTDHDHVHVAVLGYDRNRDRVKFTKNDYDHARAIGDRYLERKHEFDRYYDKSLDKMLRTEQPERGIDLEKMAGTYYRPEQEFEKKDKKHRKKREDKSFHDQSRSALPYRRKGRKQRLLESRGRKEQDYFHDLYVSGMNRSRLEQMREVRPELRDSIEQQLASQDRHDAERRAEIAKQVAELERILGITAVKPKEKEPEARDKVTGEEQITPAKDDLKAQEKLQDKQDVVDAGKTSEKAPEKESEQARAAAEKEQTPQQEKPIEFDEKPQEKPEKDLNTGTERKDDKPIELKTEKDLKAEQEQKDKDISAVTLKESAEIAEGLVKAQEREHIVAELERLRREREEEEQRLKEEEERRRQEEEERKRRQEEEDEEEEE